MISSVITTAFSGMAAQQQRLDGIASNIANADTPDYTRKRTDMVAAPGGGVKAVTREAAGGSGVDLATELVDMIGTKIAYEANVAVMETGMDMWDTLMSALEPKDRDERWR
ncbi:flagellar basal body rod protein FlgC [Hoeflea ulvae]|uniref:Flagellar basal body protein n=1 Tax=Hoeflea ulvae TaxID=2983764 RepID=A0ABT3YJ80_9HYPH|nr:flagellar basal body protein [Hoeflea ulvae]MCY0095960.1 flagellar basal body protein [Hoeflea ulvae]